MKVYSSTAVERQIILLSAHDEFLYLRESDTKYSHRGGSVFRENTPTKETFENTTHKEPKILAVQEFIYGCPMLN